MTTEQEIIATMEARATANDETYRRGIELLKAALAYIDVCPCDPDITVRQLEAWNRLCAVRGVRR